jgi:hypothetical protein
MNDQHLSNHLGDGHWRISKKMVKAFGLAETLWLTNLFDYRAYQISMGRVGKDDFFYATRDKIYKHTGIHPDTQSIYIKKFVDKGILIVDRRGQPPRNYYYINSMKMVEYVHGEQLRPDATIQLRPDATSKLHTSLKNESLKIENNKNLCSKDGSLSQQSPHRTKLNNRNPLDCHPQDATSVFLHWNSIGKPLSRHEVNPNSKTFKRSLEKIERLINQGFTVAEIKEAINNYHFFLTLPNNRINTTCYGVLCTLSEFIKFDKRTATYIEGLKSATHPLKLVSSWFEECLHSKEDIEARWSKMVKDEHPKLTEKLKELWTEYGGGNHLGVDGENVFRRLAAKAKQELEAPKGVWFTHVEGTIQSRLWHLFAALADEGTDFKLAHPSWLLSDKLFKEKLPTHWERRGMVVDVAHYEPPEEDDSKPVPAVSPIGTGTDFANKQVRRQTTRGVPKNANA